MLFFVKIRKIHPKLEAKEYYALIVLAVIENPTRNSIMKRNNICPKRFAGSVNGDNE